MADDHSPASSPTTRERARDLLLNTLGVKRVAAWCAVSEAAVYQWISRGTDANPIPPARVAPIVQGAQAAGLEAPLDVLWPAMARQGAQP